LVALGVSASGLGDWAGTDDLPFPHWSVEARERHLLGACEAQFTVALSVGAAALALAGVDPAASLRRSDQLRQAVGADHVFVVSGKVRFGSVRAPLYVLIPPKLTFSVRADSHTP
jgi:hypothetical protein